MRHRFATSAPRIVLSGHPLADVAVDVLDATGAVTQFGVTAADGTYAVTGLADGPDTVCFVGVSGVGPDGATGYQDACYGGGSGTPLVVTAGSTRSAVDASLAAD